MARLATAFSSFRGALPGVLLLSNLLSIAPGAAAQPASPVAAPEESAVTRARQDAVPMGQPATVGAFEIVVTGYDQDATDRLEQDIGGPPGWDEERFVTVAMTLTNVSDAEAVFGSDFGLDLWFAGNRGFFHHGQSAISCVVDNDVTSRQTPALAPGASLAVNVCVAVLVDDITSLQMLAIDPPAWDAGVPWADQVESGTWFGLGALRPYDPGVANEQVRVAQAIAPDDPAPWTSPATRVTTTGNLVIELLDYRPDVTSEISGDEGWHVRAPDPGKQWVSVRLRLTNVGDRPASVAVFLVGHEGVGRSNATHSKVFAHEGHLLLPGGSAVWAGQWAMPSVDPARVIAVTEADAPGVPVTWLLADPGAPFLWEVPQLRLADPAEAIETERAVPFGETASVGDLNVSMIEDVDAPKGQWTDLAVTLTYAGSPAQNAVVVSWHLTVMPASVLCNPIGGFEVLFLPGGSGVFGSRCGDGIHATTPVRIDVVNETTGEESTGLFAPEPAGG